MAMTPQQARMRALQLRSERPELQNMAVDDLIAQIMASEGMGDPGAGAVGNLSSIFPAKLVTPASPAPMQVARLLAPKPTADMVPGADVDAYRRAQEVRERTGRPLTPAATEQANARVDDLVAGLRASPEARPPEVAAEPSPIAAALSTAETPEKPKFTSRLRPQLEAVQAELEQLTAQRDTLTAQGRPVDANITYGIQIKSGVASKLKAMVDAEEAAVVDAESLAVLERQTNRLTREEELVKQARKRAPGDALIAFGNALAGAKAGEKFASVLTRGLVAGNESYTNARNAGEESRRTIEEKRDALIMKNRELIEKARADAINRANAGATLTEGEMRFANLTQEGVNNLAEAPLKLQKLTAETKEAEVKANNAQVVIDAALNESRAKAFNYMQPPAGGGGGTGGAPSQAQATKQAEGSERDLKKLEKQILASEEDGNHPQTFQLLQQYGRVKAKFNEVAAAANRSPIIAKGFPITLRGFEAYVKKNGFPSGGSAAPARAAAPAGGTKVRTYDPVTNTLK